MTATISLGDRIEVRDAFGAWHPQIARSDPFLNTAYVQRGVSPWLVVQVWSDAFGHDVNWPLEHVRPRTESMDEWFEARGDDGTKP